MSAYVLTFAVASLGAQSTRTPQGEHPVVSALRGQVVDTKTQTPLRNVHILLVPTLAGTSSLSSTTDESGRFAIDDITPRDYRLPGERRGYIRQSKWPQRAST